MLNRKGLTKATCDMKNFNHVTAMADYALRIREQLDYVNQHSFNNFKIRIGNVSSVELSRKGASQRLLLLGKALILDRWLPE